MFARLERNEASSYGKTKEETQETFSNILIDLANHVPADIDLLFHFCYGDSNHRHVVEPTDMATWSSSPTVSARQIKRPIQLIHMPVPRNRADDAYFEPLRKLKLRPETQLCLGLVHHTDGLEGDEDGGLRPRVSTSAILRSRPNAASAGAIRRQSRSCCASTHRLPRWTRPKSIAPKWRDAPGQRMQWEGDMSAESEIPTSRRTLC